MKIGFFSFIAISKALKNTKVKGWFLVGNSMKLPLTEFSQGTYMQWIFWNLKILMTFFTIISDVSIFTKFFTDISKCSTKLNSKCTIFTSLISMAIITLFFLNYVANIKSISLKVQMLIMFSKSSTKTTKTTLVRISKIFTRIW